MFKKILSQIFYATIPESFQHLPDRGEFELPERGRRSMEQVLIVMLCPLEGFLNFPDFRYIPTGFHNVEYVAVAITAKRPFCLYRYGLSLLCGSREFTAP